jgi:hypothetical protein
MRNNKLWTAAGYDSSQWLSPSGEMNDAMFIEHMAVALRNVWHTDAGFPNDSMDPFSVYYDLTSLSER